MALEKDLLMECPRCRMLIPSDSRFCQACGNDLKTNCDSNKVKGKNDPFSSLGDLCDKSITVNRDKITEPDTLCCSACGMNNPKDAIFCEHCGTRMVGSHTPFFSWKKWMPLVACCAAVFVLVIVAFNNIGFDMNGGAKGETVDKVTASVEFDERHSITKDRAPASKKENNKATLPIGYDERYSIIKDDIATAEEGIYKMKEFKGDTWFCRVSVPSWHCIARKMVETGDIWNPYYLYVVNAAQHEDFSFQTVTKGEDKLAVIGITDVSCAPIIEMGYTIPYKLGVDDGSIHDRSSIGYSIGGYSGEIEKINDQEPSNYLNRLSEYYNVLRAEKGEKFSFSYFSGTEYLKDTVIADHYYYIIEEYTKYISLPTTKTTEGYFFVDYSELNPGYYWFSAGDYDTIIEIK